MRRLAIIGDGSHARVLEDFLKFQGNSVYLVGKDAQPEEKDEIIIGVGNKPTMGDSDLGIRKRLHDLYIDRVDGFRHDTALSFGQFSGTVQLMAKCYVGHGSLIGMNTIINTGAIVEHDCIVGDHCHIAPGAILCGGVHVGDQTHIGAGAVVRQGIKIGKGCVVGAGAVVVKDMIDGSVCIGGSK